MVLHLGLQYFVPHIPWQPNHHGIRIWADLRDGEVESAELAPNHGYGYLIALHGAYEYLFFRTIPVLWVSSIVSTVTLLFVFLLGVSLFKRDTPALAAVAILVALPVRMRISATEAMSVPLELFLVFALLMFSLFVDLGRRAYFLLGLGALLLAMETRLELMIFGPQIALSLLLLSPRKVFTLVRKSWGLIAALAAFPVLLLPRIVQMFQAEPRIAQIGPAAKRSAESGFGTPHNVAFNSFFSSDFTPTIFILLFVIGLIALLRTDRVKLLVLNLLWVPLSLGYIPWFDGVSTYVRCNANTQFALALIAGVGVDALVRAIGRWGRPWALPALACAGAAALVPGLIRSSAVLLYESPQLREFKLLTQADNVLPRDATVALLAPDESAPTVDVDYQEAALRLFPPQGSRRFESLTWLLSQRPENVSGLYYYVGTPCFRKKNGPGALADWVHPLCQQVFERFDLVPEAVSEVRPARIGIIEDFDEIYAPHVIGLYRIIGAKGKTVTPTSTSPVLSAAGTGLIRHASRPPFAHLPWPHKLETMLFLMAFFGVPLAWLLVIALRLTGWSSVRGRPDRAG